MYTTNNSHYPQNIPYVTAQRLWSSAEIYMFPIGCPKVVVPSQTLFEKFEESSVIFCTKQIPSTKLKIGNPECGKQTINSTT